MANEAKPKVVDSSRNIAEVTIPEAADYLAELWGSMPPEMCPAVGLIGKPGIGKTSIPIQVAERIRPFGYRKNATVVTRHLSQVHPLDQGGVGLDQQSRTMYYAKPPLVDEVMAKPAPRILNLDELDRAQPIVQSASLQVLLEKRQNGFDLKDTYVMFCANAWHAEYTNDLDSALASRCTLLYCKSSPERWLNWAAENKVDPKVILTIAQQPDVLNQHGGFGAGDDTQSGTQTGAVKKADERAWHMLSNALVAGVSTYHADKFVGKHAAEKFQLYSRINQDYSKEVQAVVSGKPVNLEQLKLKLKGSTALNHTLFCIYLAAGGQVKDIKIARAFMENGIEQLDKERCWIAAKMITYNIPSPTLCEDPDIKRMHVEMLAAVGGRK